MAGKLAREIRQSKPFESLEEEALMNLFRTAALLQRADADLLKPYGLTPAGYNVLRILRGAGPEGLRCQDVSARLLSPDPDVTRLIDRLERRGWVTRGRADEDRRAVVNRITADGLRLLSELDPVVREFPRKLLGHLGPRRLSAAVALLESMRPPG